MLSVLPSIIILGLAALAAVRLAQVRRSPQGKVVQRVAAAQALALTVVVQGAHFGEEWATGFHERFPALLGLPAMPLSIFVTFNLAWIGIWITSVPGIRLARPVAYFAAWFLAIAGMLNGIGHPLLAIAAGGYFPGLISSPLIGAAGLWLWLRLRNATGQETGDDGPVYSG